MKIVVYSDVHGNKYALQNLINAEDFKSADLRIFLGDAVAFCPYPNECLDMIFDTTEVVLMGNHDSYAAFGLPVEELPWFSGDKQDHQKYMRDKLTNINLDRLKRLKKDHLLDVNNNKFYFSHFAWETDRLVEDDPDEPNPAGNKTGDLFKDIDADYIFFGHNHVPSEFQHNEKTFVCVGSLGMKSPANYLVLNIDNNVEIEHKSLSFNVDRLREEMIQEGYPRAKKYASWFQE